MFVVKSPPAVLETMLAAYLNSFVIEVDIVTVIINVTIINVELIPKFIPVWGFASRINELEKYIRKKDKISLSCPSTLLYKPGYKRS